MTMSKATRDELRTKILSDYKPKSEVIKFMGAQVEVHQPSLRALLDSQDKGSTADKMIDMIINFVFVPGTKEHIFETADKESLLNMPWNEDIAELQNVIGRLSGIDVEAAVKDLNESPLESAS